jgi:hypothetical protein
MAHNKQLTIKYLIDLLNDHATIQIDRKKYLIDSYPILKINNVISYNNLLTGLLIAYKNIKYDINNETLRVSLDDDIIKNSKIEIEKFIRNSSIDLSKKKKYINFIISNNNPVNDSILVLTYYFGINLIIYHTESQISKCYYYDNFLDRDLPFIIIKETKDSNSANSYYELVFSQNKYLFEFNHPMICELMQHTFIVGLEQNKKLEYLNNCKVSDILEDNLQKKEVVKLKLIPKRFLRILREYQNSNYQKIY